MENGDYFVGLDVLNMLHFTYHANVQKAVVIIFQYFCGCVDSNAKPPFRQGRFLGINTVIMEAIESVPVKSPWWIFGCKSLETLVKLQRNSVW